MGVGSTFFRILFSKSDTRRGELQLLCAVTVAAASAGLLSLGGEHKGGQGETTLMDTYVERSVELGAIASANHAVSAVGSLEFVRANPSKQRSPADDVELQLPSDAPVTSRVIANIHTPDGATINTADIEHIVVGVRPNQAFRTAIADQEQRTEATSPVLSQLDPGDRTFVMLWARGYRLVSASASASQVDIAKKSDRSFLKLDSQFAPGKPIQLDLVVEREGLPGFRSRVLSAEGTRAELPPFRE